MTSVLILTEDFTLAYLAAMRHLCGVPRGATSKLCRNSLHRTGECIELLLSATSLCGCVAVTVLTREEFAAANSHFSGSRSCHQICYSCKRNTSESDLLKQNLGDQN